MKLFVAVITCGSVVVSDAAGVAAPGTCALKNCALKSKLASAGPGFPDGVRFYSTEKATKENLEGCPFADDNDPEPSKKEYLKYMRGLGKVAEMSREDRVAYAQKMEAKWLAESEEPELKAPVIDVTKPGIEAVNSTTWRQLRRANEFDFLITFYAPWCPHCKAFVTGANAPIKALSASLEQAKGPKVVSFDVIASSPPISIEAVPAIYLFKKTGEAILFEGDQHDAEGLMAFAMGNPKPATALLATKMSPQALRHEVPSFACPLKNCVLKSEFAKAGPAFPDGVRFFAASSTAKDTRVACPFGGADDDPEPSKKEYMKYMKGLAKAGNMNADERRQWALANQDKWLNEQMEREEKAVKEPRIDVTKPGIEAVNFTTWQELRNANKYDFLITFYAPWCPHCKSFVLGENAPVKALSESLEKAGGPYAVTFDIQADDPPLSIDAVPTVFLFRTDGQAITFEGNPHDVESLMAFALDNATPKKAKQALISRHLRQASA